MKTFLGVLHSTYYNDSVNQQITLEHEAAHVAAALFCGLAVVSASVRLGDDGNPVGVTIAAAGPCDQVYYSWCVFYLFPYVWETKQLGVSYPDAVFSCSADLKNYSHYVTLLWPKEPCVGFNEITEECHKLLNNPLVLHTVQTIAGELAKQPTLEQGDIYRAWAEVVKRFEIEQPPTGS